MDKVWCLESFVKDENVINLQTDVSCDMARVELNGEEILEGNYWDFHPGCQGNVLPEKYTWKGRNDFVQALSTYVMDLGKTVEVKHEAYIYEK